MRSLPETAEECREVLGVKETHDIDRVTGAISRYGWGHSETGPVILKLIDRYNISSFVEVGSHAGYLSELVAKMFPQTQIYCIDRVFPRPLLHQQYSNITQITEDSSKAASNFKDFSVDMSYIDASHDYASVKKDLSAWWPKTKKILSGHDYNHTAFQGVLAAVDEFCAEKALKINTEDYHNYWVEQKNPA